MRAHWSSALLRSLPTSNAVSAGRQQPARGNFAKRRCKCPGKTEGIGKFPASLEQQDAETISETLADAYLESAESSDDQTQVVLLQGLAEKAIARLAWLRSLTTA